MILDSSSEQKLVGVHPDLVRVIRRAALASTIGFRVIEGVRTLARQKQLKAAGASRTLNSRHLKAGLSQVSHAQPGDLVILARGKGGHGGYFLRWDERGRAVLVSGTRGAGWSASRPMPPLAFWGLEG